MQTNSLVYQNMPIRNEKWFTFDIHIPNRYLFYFGLHVTENLLVTATYN